MTSKVINQYTIEDARKPGVIVLSIKTPWIRIGAELFNQTFSSPSTRRVSWNKTWWAGDENSPQLGKMVRSLKFQCTGTGNLASLWRWSGCSSRANPSSSGSNPPSSEPFWNPWCLILLVAPEDVWFLYFPQLDLHLPQLDLHFPFLDLHLPHPDHDLHFDVHFPQLDPHFVWGAAVESFASTCLKQSSRMSGSETGMLAIWSSANSMCSVPLSTPRVLWECPVVVSPDPPHGCAIYCVLCSKGSDTGFKITKRIRSGR